VTREAATLAWEAKLPTPEFERLLATALAELDGREGEEMLAFMAWFNRRYPTPLERLRFTTREWRRSNATRGILTQDLARRASGGPRGTR